MSKTLATGMLEQLRNNIHRIAPALYVDGVWTVDDLDGANQDLRNATDLLHRCGAIQKEGTVHINEQQGMRRISQWRWTDTRLQGKLQAFHAERGITSATLEATMASETAEPCPMCGEPTKRLPDHLPCDGVRPLEGYE